MPKPSGMTTLPDLWVYFLDNLNLCVYPVSSFSACWNCFRANSSGFILQRVENWLQLTLRPVSSDLSVGCSCSGDHVSVKTLSSQICWKSLESPFSSKLSGIITSSIRFCLRRSLNCSVNLHHWKQEEHTQISGRDLMFMLWLCRDAADHQQPLWLRLHLPRRDDCAIYQRCRGADGHWCEERHIINLTLLEVAGKLMG